MVVLVPFNDDQSIPRSGRQDNGDNNNADNGDAETPDDTPTTAPTPELVTLNPDDTPNTQTSPNSITVSAPIISFLQGIFRMRLK